MSDKYRVRPMILLVEDFTDTRELSADYLRDSGFDVVAVGDGEQAIARAAELLPDVVVLDLTLPVVDGWEAIQRLKADERTSRIPIIVTSGHRPETHRQMIVDAGCVAYLQKPCVPDDLIAEIRRALAV
jgi:two-component system cell cycle response regulator DivK